MSNVTKRNHSKNKELTFPSLIKRTLLFTAIFALLSVLIILVLSVIFYGTEKSDTKIPFISIISIYASALITSFLLSKFNGHFYFWGGLILGGFALSLILISSIFIKNDSQNLLFQLAIPLITILGALLGQKRAPKRKNHRQHR